MVQPPGPPGLKTVSGRTKGLRTDDRLAHTGPGDFSSSWPRVVGVVLERSAPRWQALLSTVAIETLGTGLALPFGFIYLHEVRGFSIETAGSLLAAPAIVGMAVVGPAGALLATRQRWYS